MSALRIGSLCSGYGGLDMAVMDVLDASVAWHAQYDPDDHHQWAAQILAHHWPAVPNHGDITAADWSRVEPIDVLTAGFPCQDLSLAGKREGMREGNRSGLWFHVARAIETLRPRLVVIENVPGILTSAADGDLEPCPWCLGDTGGEPPLRALGAVLADLARLGFDAEWTSLGAADVGAPHRRRRVFLLAWPVDSEGPRLETRRAGRPGRVAAADPARVGHERGRPARLGRPGPADGRLASADSQGLGWVEGRTESARELGGSDAPERGRPAPADADRAGALAELDREPHRPEALDEHAVSNAAGRVLDWGDYGPAIERWERVMMRPAPAPTEPGRTGERLSPAFVEWMMGCPEGWITSVPGIPRTAQLKALGNGVVRQQGAAALEMLLERAPVWLLDGQEVAA